MLVFTEPISSGRSAGAARAQDRAQRLHLDRIAERGAGAVGLDVARRRRGATPACASAARITASWAGPLGAVRPLLRPSWLTAVPRITARMRSPSACASERRLSTTTPQPSPRTKPSADASKVLQRPSGASIRAFEK